MAEVTRAKEERIFLRCSRAEKESFRIAATRDGFRDYTQWLLRLARLASRTAVATARAINVSALVRP